MLAITVLAKNCLEELFPQRACTQMAHQHNTLDLPRSPGEILDGCLQSKIPAITMSSRIIPETIRAIWGVCPVATSFLERDIVQIVL